MHDDSTIKGLARGLVELVPYDSAWTRQFHVESERLRSALPDLLRIEHVGSTAIPGIRAKPILDLVAAVQSLDVADTLIGRLESLGYEFRPTDVVVDRRFFARGPHTRRTHHLSLCALDSSFLQEKLLFRDYLRAHPDRAIAYENLKIGLAQRFPRERPSYTEGKLEFVQETLALARHEKKTKSDYTA